MLHKLNAVKKAIPSRHWAAFAVATIFVVITACQFALAATPAKQKSFASPEEAVKAALAAAKKNDDKELLAIFGAQAKDLMFSGDAVADKQRRERFLAAYDEKNTLVSEGESRIITVGNDAWPFPIPLIKVSGGWQYDTEAGREEIENRRIGINEIQALATLHAVVDAQREYFAGRHDGRTGVYAKRVISSKGKQDGLYWPTPEGKKPSPLGPLIGEATAEGYSTDNTEPKPFHGYYYRVLTAQGPNASGGAKSYLDAKGVMTKGFAMVAWPAKHGNSGLMTFLVDHKGIVFQKDLGEQTSAAAGAITAFDPDDTWAPTGD